MGHKICMIAHRGYSSAYPENTETAFIKAAEHGSGGAETDVRITSDGVYVTSHNAEVVFEDGTELKVAEHTYAELTAKPIRQSKIPEKVYLCTFRRYLEIMRDAGMVCFIELKGQYTKEQVKGVFDLAAEVYDLKKCILQSFEFENLLFARELFPELDLMFTYGTGQDRYERCFEHGISIDCDQYVLTERMVKEFHDNGLAVAVWTVNDRERLEIIKALEPDYIESDVFGGEIDE
ncbi:MAG: hypothetical protein K6C36_05120 [Clostridia bacterium]|nr:hypothetical protein [Clostridia bacterium]